MWRRLAAFCYDLLLLAALVFSFTLLVLAVRLGAPVPPGTLVVSDRAWSRSPCVLLRLLGARRPNARHARVAHPRRARRRRRADLAAERRTVRRRARRRAPAGLGLWWSVFDADKRGWHDRWTGTRVVRAATASKR